MWKLPEFSWTNFNRKKEIQKTMYTKFRVKFHGNSMEKLMNKNFSTKFLVELQGTFMELFWTWNSLNYLSELFTRVNLHLYLGYYCEFEKNCRLIPRNFNNELVNFFLLNLTNTAIIINKIKSLLNQSLRY